MLWSATMLEYVLDIFMNWVPDFQIVPFAALDHIVVATNLGKLDHSVAKFRLRTMDQLAG
jgi:hypothetical protein